MTVRIAMWSGPRNISTAMMRAFENRPDTAVSDEPFYAAYLAGTGLDHPMREEVLASQPTDWRLVADAMAGPAPGDAPVWYQKHMTHHMLPGFGMDWAGACRSAFLIRAPEAVLASYTVKREQVTLDDIGFVQQRELFEREADRLGAAPPVIEGRDVLADPRGTLGKLCAALGIAFDDAMLAWPAGRRDSDGVWAPAWYDAVEASTGFGPPRSEAGRDDLNDDLRRIADAARPHYERLAAFKL
ncbi:MAG: sulfotransferase [Caulobacter sp.]|nr:sulfotransferase [Caulobacter sp.]